MRKWRWVLIAVSVVGAFAIFSSLPDTIHRVRMDMRLREALSFPKEGYESEHASLITEAVIWIDEDDKGMRLIVDVTIDNTGAKPFKNVLAAVKLHDDIGRFTVLGGFPLHMLEPADMLTPGLSPTGIGIGRSTPLIPMTEEELEELIALLEGPIFVKMVHDDGVELLRVAPTLVLPILH